MSAQGVGTYARETWTGRGSLEATKGIEGPMRLDDWGLPGRGG
jgi:hypothetical protein